MSTLQESLPYLVGTAWLLFCIYVVLVITGQAVDLSITGHITGQGIQNLSYAGDLLNVSIYQNGSGWNFTLLGGAA
jgi:hypothetical protein